MSRTPGSENRSSSEIVLECDGLEKSYWGHLRLRRYRVLEGLSLQVRRGEIYGMLGQNGAGKTTTIKSILGLVFPDRGQVRIFGKRNTLASVRGRIGFLPENPYFYEYLTGREFLDYCGRLFGYSAYERQERVGELLRRVGMESRSDIQLRKFSKGMVQRIGLAQALINDPDFLILDEPMSGLDPIGRREFRDIILSLREKGKTVFFSSHILSDAEALCDRIAIVKDGVVSSEGTLADLISPEVSWWEVGYVGPGLETLKAEGELVAVRGVQSIVRVGTEESLSRLLEAVHAAGGKLISVSPHKETLEDLYLKEVAAS